MKLLYGQKLKVYNQYLADAEKKRRKTLLKQARRNFKKDRSDFLNKYCPHNQGKCVEKCQHFVDGKVTSGIYWIHGDSYVAYSVKPKCKLEK